MWKLFLLIAGVALFCVSCDRDRRAEEEKAPAGQGAAAVSNERATYAEMGANQIIASVGDYVLTKQDAENEAELQIALYGRKTKSPAKQAKVASRRNIIVRKVIASFVSRMLVIDYIAKTNYQVTAAARQAHQARVMKAFGSKGETFDRLCTSLGPLEKSFRTKFEYDLITEDFLHNTYSNELSISEADIDNAIARFKKMNENGEATNKLTRVRAAEICKRAKAGEDFAKLSDKYSEDPDREPGGDLGECDQNHFSMEPEIWNKLILLKKGEVSDVIESDFGFYIYKCRDRLEPGADRSSTELVLSEINFKKAMSFPERSRRDLRREGEQQQREEVIGIILKAHAGKVKVRAPDMQTLFPKKKKSKLRP